MVSDASTTVPVFTSFRSCLYKIQKGSSCFIFDLDGLFCRTSVFYGGSWNGDKGEYPVYSRNAPAIFALYSGIFHCIVVCLLLSPNAVECAEKSGFRRIAVSWHGSGAVCKSVTDGGVFKHSLDGSEMF